MIYLIEIPKCKYDSDGKVIEYFQALKIGYTNDEELDITKNKRLVTYRSYYGSSMKLLKIIPNATEEQEKKLHYKFKDYLVEGNEWYSYNDEIVNFISNVTLEELTKLPGKVKREAIYKTKTIIKNVLKYIVSTEEEIELISDSIFLALGNNITSEDVVVDYISNSRNDLDLTKYVDHKRKEKTKIYDEDPSINSELVEFFDQYYSKTKITEKLQLLCECNLSEGIINIILTQIPDSDIIKSYYLMLGPQKLRALGYNYTYIKKELGIVSFSPEVLINTIYSNFKVGEKWKVSDIKEKLANLYNSISYKKTPKATDLEEFFEVKECKIPIIDENGNKKRTRGYELIKSYELEMRIKLEQMNKN